MMLFLFLCIILICGEMLVTTFQYRLKHYRQTLAANTAQQSEVHSPTELCKPGKPV